MHGQSKECKQDQLDELLNCEKPNDKWIHVFELWTSQRVYRLFTDSYDIKQQWIFTITAIIKEIGTNQGEGGYTEPKIMLPTSFGLVSN